MCFAAAIIDPSDGGQSNMYLGVVLFLLVAVTSLFSFYQE